MASEQEFGILVKAMKAVYAKPDFLPDDAAIEVWYQMLRDLDYSTLAKAVQKHMMTSPYTPTVADLRAAAAEFSAPPDCGIPALEAWSLVRRAIRNAIYHAEEEYAQLPVPVQKAIGSPGNLREWAQMDTETVESVQQSQFLRSYRATVQRERELAQLSPAMRSLLEGTAARMLGAEKAALLPEQEKET